MLIGHTLLPTEVTCTAELAPIEPSHGNHPAGMWLARTGVYDAAVAPCFQALFHCDPQKRLLSRRREVHISTSTKVHLTVNTWRSDILSIASKHQEQALDKIVLNLRIRFSNFHMRSSQTALPGSRIPASPMFHSSPASRHHQGPHRGSSTPCPKHLGKKHDMGLPSLVLTAFLTFHRQAQIIRFHIWGGWHTK